MQEAFYNSSTTDFKYKDLLTKRRILYLIGDAEINLQCSTEILIWFDISKKLYQDSLLSGLIIKMYS